MSEEKNEWSERVFFTDGKLHRAGQLVQTSSPLAVSDSPIADTTSDWRRAARPAGQPWEALQASLLTPLPLPYSQVPPLTSRFPHWLRGRPMSQRGARAPIPGRGCPLSFPSLASVWVSGGGGGGSRALRVAEAEGTAGLTIDQRQCSEQRRLGSSGGR